MFRFDGAEAFFSKSYGAQEELVNSRWDFSSSSNGRPQPPSTYRRLCGKDGGVARSIFFFDAYRFARSLHQRPCLSVRPSLLYLLVPRSEGFLFPVAFFCFFFASYHGFISGGFSSPVSFCETKNISLLGVYRTGHLSCNAVGYTWIDSGTGRTDRPKDDGGLASDQGGRATKIGTHSVKSPRQPGTPRLVPVPPAPGTRGMRRARIVVRRGGRCQ